MKKVWYLKKKIPPLPWELFMIQIINILTPSTDKTIQPLKLLKIKFENLLRKACYKCCISHLPNLIWELNAVSSNVKQLN